MCSKNAFSCAVSFNSQVVLNSSSLRIQNFKRSVLQQVPFFKMKKFGVDAIIFCTAFLLQSNRAWGKPGGEYAAIGDYGVPEIGSAYQTLPDGPPLLTKVATTDLKPASSYDVGYGGPIAEPIIPAIFPVRGLGWGWKQPIPQPIIAPIQVIAKPVPFPVTIPLGWGGWQSPGIF